MAEPVWLRGDVVRAIHGRQLAEHGGPSGARDEGLLESALAAPENRWRYERSSIPEFAACYAFHLAGNHPFIDGNKRTAYVCMRLFLKLNGMDLSAGQQEKIRIMMDLSAGRLSFDEFAAWVVSKSDPAQE
jgi:death-on-curing protein